MKVALILSALFLAACFPGGASGAIGSNVPIPATGTYLGVRLDSTNVSGAGIPGAAEFAQLPAFNALMGRHMAFIPIFLGFGRTLPLASLTSADQLAGIPLVDLSCTEVNAVTAGTNDAYLTALAGTIKSFGKPVFVRWYWEMNKNDITHTSQGCDAYGNGPGFISAWKHIWTVLHNAGAANVSLIWCPSANDASSATYYPGDIYVDWIAGDGFNRNKPNASTFDAVFGPWYAQWSAHPRPLMIGSTGAVAAVQVKYFSDIRTEFPVKYPKIKALNYFDAWGNNGDFTLQGAGLTAFKTMANTPYFMFR